MLNQQTTSITFKVENVKNSTFKVKQIALQTYNT